MLEIFVISFGNYLRLDPAEYEWLKMLKKGACQMVVFNILVGVNSGSDK